MRTKYISIFVALALTSCGEGTTTNALEAIKDQMNSSSDWSVVEKVNPMTDERVLTATQTFVENPFKVNFEISCVGGKDIFYRAAVYNMTDQPAEFNLSSTEIGVVGAYELRLDDQKARSVIFLNPRFTNTLDIDSNTIPGFNMQDANKLAMSEKIAFHLPLSNGDVNFSFDQSDSSIQRVLASCAAGIEASKAREERAREQAQAAEISAPEPDPSTEEPAVPPVVRSDAAMENVQVDGEE